MIDIIAAQAQIGKFFYEYGFNEILSSVPQNRLVEIISGLAMKGNQSKTTDFAELDQRVRTTYGYFLSKGKWNEKKVSQKQREGAFRKLSELALVRQILLYLSIDDTVIEKKKPSSRAKRQWRELAGIVLIWKASRYSAAGYLEPILAWTISPCATIAHPARV